MTLFHTHRAEKNAVTVCLKIKLNGNVFLTFAIANFQGKHMGEEKNLHDLIFPMNQKSSPLFPDGVDCSISNPA